MAAAFGTNAMSSPLARSKPLALITGAGKYPSEGMASEGISICAKLVCANAGATRQDAAPISVWRRVILKPDEILLADICLSCLNANGLNGAEFYKWIGR